MTASDAAPRGADVKLASLPGNESTGGDAQLQMMNEDLRQELLRLRAEDQRVRDELAADGSLFDGYHPRMEAVHQRNAAQLAEIIKQYGWPDERLVGADGADAAWLIAQHAIGAPDFQRQCLAALQQAAARGTVPHWQAAYLADRVRTFAGRPQLYGTQYDWDEQGELNPLPVDDVARVDKRRKHLGLIPLAKNTQRMRAGVRQSGEQAPADWVKRQTEFAEWARRVGWRA